MKKKYYFYIVRCSDNSLYSGITTDLERRVEEHNSESGKGAKYTRSHRPVRVVYSEEFPSKSDAMKREWAVKQWSKIQKEALITHQSKDKI